MKFKKKPTIVEAEQFLLGEPLPFNERGFVVCLDELGWYVTTIQGQRASIVPGDWIILEPHSSFEAYPCHPDVFEERYERV